MLRHMNNVVSARIIFVRAPMVPRSLPRQSCFPNLFINHYPTDFQIASFTRTPINFKYKDPKEREPCPVPPPPPPPPPKDEKLFWGAMAMLFMAGGFVVYAKSYPEVRDWLTINAPWVDDFIAVMYQENMTYGEFANACIEDTKRYLERYKGDNKPKECSTGGKPVKDGPDDPKCGEPPKVSEKPPPPPICVKPDPPQVTKSLCEVEKCMIELADCALNNYNTAKEACACYNSLVQDTMAMFTYKGMKDAKYAMEERLKLVEISLKNATRSIEKFDELARYLDCGVRDTKEKINNTKLLYKDYQEKFKIAFMAYQWENDKSVAMDRQCAIVEELITKYTKENEYLLHGLKYSSDKPLHTTGDLDTLFIASLRYLQHLQPQLKDASDSMAERCDRAINDLPQKSNPAFVQALAAAIKEKKVDSDKDFKRREDEQKQTNERNLKEALKKQKDAHELTLTAKLAEIEKQVMVKFNKLVAEKVAYEKNLLAKERSEMAAKLKEVEDKLEERLKAERETRRSQELWAAGASLLAATKKGDRYVRVDKELKAIERASGDNDKLVLTVLKSIPKSVREKGIVPESVLRDKFRTMEKTARSVALIEQEGAGMPVYILSWVQGLLLFMKMSGIPQREFEKPPMVVSEDLDTFDLLQRARFWVERGNLAIAVRYVDSLKGASRAAAHKWFEAARAHLEVRQAAEAVLAHAAAMGLRYI